MRQFDIIGSENVSALVTEIKAKCKDLFSMIGHHHSIADLPHVPLSDDEREAFAGIMALAQLNFGENITGCMLHRLKQWGIVVDDENSAEQILNAYISAAPERLTSIDEVMVIVGACVMDLISTINTHNHNSVYASKTHTHTAADITGLEFGQQSVTVSNLVDEGIDPSYVEYIQSSDNDIAVWLTDNALTLESPELTEKPVSMRDALIIAGCAVETAISNVIPAEDQGWDDSNMVTEFEQFLAQENITLAHPTNELVTKNQLYSILGLFVYVARANGML